MVDLFALATANARMIEEQHARLRASLPDADTAAFDLIGQIVTDRGHVSINLRQTGMLRLLTVGKHENAYEIAQEQSNVTGEPVEDILRKWLGPYWKPRVAFDAYFEDGPRFRYGALNIGCAGATHYGEFCAVIGRAYLTKLARLAYLKSDSLKTYMLPGPSVDEAAMRVDLTREPQKHLLASIKYASQLVRETQAKWPSVLCNDADYIEAIFVGDFGPRDLGSIRIRESDYERFAYLVVEIAREDVSEGEHMLAAEFREIILLLAAQNVPLEVVHA